MGTGSDNEQVVPAKSDNEQAGPVKNEETETNEENVEAFKSLHVKHGKQLQKVKGLRHSASRRQSTLSTIHGHGAKEPSILTAVASAVINFLLMFGLCCAYGIIMFEDSWHAQHRGLGVKMNLCSALIMGLLLAVTSKVGVAIGGPDLNPVVFLGMFVNTISENLASQHGLTLPGDDGRRLLDSCSAFLSLDPAEALRRLGDASSDSTAEFCIGEHYEAHVLACDSYHDELRATSIFAVALSSLILGILFLILGRLRMTRFVTYVPTNIMEAFLSCVGYKVFKYALKFCKYKPQQFVPAACIGVPLYFLKALHVGNPAVVIPLVLLLPLAIFYTIVYSTGGTVATARSAGWMFDELANVEFFTVWTDSVGKASSINFKAWADTGPDLAVMIIVCMLDCMLKVSSTESKLPVQVDKDYEVQLYGVGNLATTLCGSSVGYMQLKFNVINFGVMGNIKDRRGGAIYALLCGIFFFWTTDLFNYLPRFFLSTLLFFAGSGFVVENLWGSRKYLSVTEWLQIIFIMGVFIFMNSLLYAVIAGGLITGATFIIRYSTIPCIAGPPSLGGQGRLLENTSFLLQRKVEHLADSWMLVIKLKGFIFFASAQSLVSWIIEHLERQQQRLPPYQRIHWLVFDCTQLDGLDSSASKTFGKLAHTAELLEFQILWSGAEEHFTDELKACGTVTSEKQICSCLAEARVSVERRVHHYLSEQQEKWLNLQPLFRLAHNMSRERMIMEPFEDILNLDMTRFGCPWQYCSRMRIRAFSTLLWRAGETRKTIFLVHSGKVGMFTKIPGNMETGRWEMPVAIYGRGQIINREVLRQQSMRLNAVALEDGELLCWNEVQWACMNREHPAMTAAIMKVVLKQERLSDNTPLASGSTEQLQFQWSSSNGEKAPRLDKINTKLFTASSTTACRSKDVLWEELRPWYQGLETASGLEKLGLFDAPGMEAEQRHTPSLLHCLEEELHIAFRTYSEGDDEKGVIREDRVIEALMYAGIVGLIFKIEGPGDLTEAQFMALGKQVAMSSFSNEQEGALRNIFRKCCAGKTMDSCTGGTLDRAAVTRLLREQVHPGITVEEVDDVISLCAGTAARCINEAEFLAVMGRLVRKHERDWCVLLGFRQLLGSSGEQKGLGTGLTPEMLCQNSESTLTMEEAGEMLWCANFLSREEAPGFNGSKLDARMVHLALWPLDVPSAELPPVPRIEKKNHSKRVSLGSTSCWATPTNSQISAPLSPKADDKLRSLVTDVRNISMHRGFEDVRLEGRFTSSTVSAKWCSARMSHLIRQVTTMIQPIEEDDDNRDEKPLSCRARVRLFVDFPESSPWAGHWSVIMGVFIMVSVLTLILEPLVSPPEKVEDRPQEKAVWRTFEIVFTMVFTLEFLIRLAVADSMGDQTVAGFLMTPMNICDIIAILPWYLDEVLNVQEDEFRLFRILRLLRLARLARLGRLASKSAQFAPIAVILVVIWGIFIKNQL